MQTPSIDNAQPINRVKHVAHLARHFGKVRSFALEALLHLAMSSMDQEMKASTGHTLSQNLDAMAALLKIIRDGDTDKNLDKTVFAEILDRDDVDGGVVGDAEHLLEQIEKAQNSLNQGNFPTAAEVEGLFETYTALRIRISGFLRQVEALTDEWQASDANINHMRNKFASAVNDLENISSAINMLAINASVEASRAGDHGAAFSVIAQEMHRLSSQSSQLLRSTRDTLGM